VAMFGLGTVAAQRGWLEPVPARIGRRCGFAALGGLMAFAVLGATMAATGVDGEVLFDLRLHWAPLTLLQGVALIGLMIALRPLGVPAEIKALAVAALGVAGSFGLAWLLVTRTRLGRML
jgi:hypothetical protein